MQLPNLVSSAVRYVKRILGFPNQQLNKDNKITSGVESDIPSRNADVEHLQLEEKVKFLTHEMLAIKNELTAVGLNPKGVLSKMRRLD